MRPVVLALRALALGDLLAGLPALRGLRAAFPDHELVLAAPAWLAPLALHAGAADRVHHATEELGPVGVLRPAVAVNLHGRGPESHRRLLETGPDALIAFRHPGVPESAGMPRWRAGEHEVRRWCRLLVESGIPADPSRLELDSSGLPEPGRVAGATVVHPGAATIVRHWPVARWAAVARHEAAAGRDVVVTAGPGEERLAAAVAERAGLPPAAIWSGRGVLDLAGLLAGAGRLVCADTGVAHLATALGLPSVVLFGPKSPAEWGPPALPRHVALWAGRLGDSRGAGPDPGLLEIQAAQVVAALDGLPSR